MLTLTNSINLTYYYEWAYFLNIISKIHIFTFFKFLLICIIVYLGYVCKFYINGNKCSQIVIYLLQPMLLFLTLLNLSAIDYSSLYILPIIMYLVLSINIVIFDKFLSKFVPILPINNKYFILLTSTSLNLGYIGSSILIFYYDIIDVSIIVTLCSVGSILFLFTIGFLYSSDNFEYNIKFVKYNPTFYTIILFLIFNIVEIDYSEYMTYVHNILCLTAFIYFKLGLYVFGINFNSKITLKPLYNNKDLQKSIKYIIFNKYLILPIFFSLILIILDKYYLNLKKDYIHILLILIYCPVAFNISFINNFFFEKFSDINLLLVTFITLIISISILLMLLLYLM